tara:strand:+ start:454 stop:1647 length:1194 start_codon:yes stop_codon:yes gene_type:complete
MRKNKTKKRQDKVITNKKDGEIIQFLKKHVNLLDDKYDNKKMSDYIFKKLVQSKKESETVFHEQELFDMKPIDCPRGAFFTPIIEKYINDTLHYQYDIRFTFKHIDFFIHIVFQGKIHIQKYIDYIKWIICLCLCDTKNNSKQTIQVTFYLTNMEKAIPIDFQNNIQVEHINSGFSYWNHELQEKKIYIYRKEEWLKVFIHECFHMFNMDLPEYIQGNTEQFKELFHIQSEFIINECFVEFWARILNCALFTYGLKDDMNTSEFHTLFSLNLNIERLFSLFQACKLLNQYQLTYNDIIDEKTKHICRSIYKEETNAFSYYVLTSILMDSFPKTLEWFDVHNDSLFHFKKSEQQIQDFCRYIKERAKDSKLIQLFNSLNVHKLKELNKMKMTIFEIDL